MNPIFEKLKNVEQAYSDLNPVVDIEKLEYHLGSEIEKQKTIALDEIGETYKEIVALSAHIEIYKNSIERLDKVRSELRKKIQDLEYVVITSTHDILVDYQND